jgi:hypothetical protein
MREVESSVAPNSLTEATRTGLANRIDTAIRLLRLCDEHNVTTGAHWDSVPDIVNPSYMPEILIVDDGETDDPSGWREVEFSRGIVVRLRGGETIIGGRHALVRLATP